MHYISVVFILNLAIYFLQYGWKLHDTFSKNDWPKCIPNLTYKKYTKVYNMFFFRFTEFNWGCLFSSRFPGERLHNTPQKSISWFLLHYHTNGFSLPRKEKETLFLCIQRRETSEQEQLSRFKWYWKRTFLSHLFTSLTQKCIYAYTTEFPLLLSLLLLGYLSCSFHGNTIFYLSNCILWIDWEFYIHACKSNLKCGLVVNRWK